MCPRLKYDKETVQEFEIYLKEIGGFKEAIWKRQKEIEREKIRAQEMIEAAKVVESNTAPVAAGIAGGTTQLVKSRPPPLWSGQNFDRWKIEVERWYENNRASVEDKFLDLMESLKNNKQ